MANENDSLLGKLQFLAQKGQEFDNPYDDTIKKKKPTFEKTKRHKKNKNDDFDSFIAESEEYFERAAEDGDFDAILDGIDYEDDDLELRDSLIAMGRKYARDYSSNPDENEITKAFAPQEAQLKDLYATIAKEAMKLEGDIENIRQTNYAKSFSRLADLVEVKTSLLTSQLQVIKEMNSVKKAQFDIRNKMKETQSTDGNGAAESVIQSLFGIGHEAMLSGVGGRSGSSGAYSTDNGVEEDDSFESSEAYGELMSGTDDDSDGAKFLKYEGENISLVLTDYEDGRRVITAEDENGNVIDDYPIPSNVEELRFDINNKTNIAVDQLQRKYKYRIE